MLPSTASGLLKVQPLNLLTNTCRQAEQHISNGSECMMRTLSSSRTVEALCIKVEQLTHTLGACAVSTALTSVCRFVCTSALPIRKLCLELPSAFVTAVALVNKMSQHFHANTCGLDMLQHVIDRRDSGQKSGWKFQSPLDLCTRLRKKGVAIRNASFAVHRLAATALT